MYEYFYVNGSEVSPGKLGHILETAIGKYVNIGGHRIGCAVGPLAGAAWVGKSCGDPEGFGQVSATIGRPQAALAKSPKPSTETATASSKGETWKAEERWAK